MAAYVERVRVIVERAEVSDAAQDVPEGTHRAAALLGEAKGRDSWQKVRDETHYTVHYPAKTGCSVYQMPGRVRKKRGK